MKSWTGWSRVAALRLRGLEPGSRVALYLQRDERYVALVLALIRAGQVACPIKRSPPTTGRRETPREGGLFGPDLRRPRSPANS